MIGSSPSPKEEERLLIPLPAKDKDMFGTRSCPLPRLCGTSRLPSVIGGFTKLPYSPPELGRAEEGSKHHLFQG